METYRRLEDLVVYQKLCRLHIEIGDLTHQWPTEEKYELGSQARRSSNSAPAQLAEKYDDRHVRNKIEGVNRSRGEAAETVHHLYMAHLKGYETQTTYEEYRVRYQECIRMLNGMERTLEKQLPESDRRWPNSSVREDAATYESSPFGFPEPWYQSSHEMNKNIRTFLDTCIADKVFPGCTLGIIRQGSQDIIAAGRLTYDPTSPQVINDTIYDVASITKAVPTACLALQLIEQGALSLSSRLADHVPESCGRYHDQIRLEHLLTHTLDFDFRLSDKKSLPPAAILKAICSSDLKSPPGDIYCYANATSILLGLMVERATGTPLDILAQKRFFGPLAMTSTTFFPDTLDRALIAPSEIDPWRGREIRGEVHDESAWALRPVLVAGSAGLFSTTPDLLRFLMMLLNQGEFGGTRYFARDTIALMHTNAICSSLGTTIALGWELDQERFMGANRTAATFGKTGFTGCTIVADPQEKTGFVFLTNHTWPERRKDKEEINRVRRGLADIIFTRQGRPPGR